MADLETPGRGADTASGTYVLGPGTLAAVAIAVCLAQVTLLAVRGKTHETLLDPHTLSEG